MVCWNSVDIGRSILIALLLIAAARGPAEAEAQGSTPIEEQRLSASASEVPGSTAPLETYLLLSVAERTLLTGYQKSLRSAVAREASLEHMLGQLAHNPPVAYVNGYWATPVDLATLLQTPQIRAELKTALPVSPAGDEASLLLDDMRRLKQLAAIAFTAKPLREKAGLPYVGELRRLADGRPQAIGVFLVPIKDVDWSLVEYLPPLPEPGAETECYFYCGDAETWDFDGDGTPDIRDEDDDNDGTADDHDDYPYWPVAASCECDTDVLVVLVTKFAVSIRNSVLAALNVLADLDETSIGVELGSLGADDIPVQLVIPAALADLGDRPGASDCPTEGAPGVSYISTDPNNCATIRFRCSAGQVGFTNRCGCGCLDETAQ